MFSQMCIVNIYILLMCFCFKKLAPKSISTIITRKLVQLYDAKFNFDRFAEMFCGLVSCDLLNRENAPWRQYGAVSRGSWLCF